MMGSVLVVLMLVGCSDKSSTTSNDGNNLNSSPEQSAESLQTSAAVPSVGPAPTPSVAPTATVVEQAPVVLETVKLHGTFGFADVEGKHILVTGHEEGLDKEMALLNRAIGDNGKVLTVRFDKWQNGNENNNGREMAHNFANLPGYLFEVEEGSASTDKTYYVTDSVDFNPQVLVPIKPTDVDQASTTVEESVRTSITTMKQRELQQIWKLADLTTNRQLYLVQFVRQDKDMLFSLILKDKEEFFVMDYPAVIGEDEYSVWRVDDGGEVRPEMFSIMFAAETSDGILLGMEWWGAEGVNTFFLHQEGDSFKEMDIHYGRYTSPI